jgi:putative component of membrane protein insertase Oxa1/YidC/SpoIIIJ protein YidD
LEFTQPLKDFMGTLAAQFADCAIDAYQRYISPYKGFCCAYRAHTGKRSCSAYGRAVVQKLGLMALIAALPKQFERCKLAYQNLLAYRVSMKSQADDRRKKTDADACDLVDLSCDVGDAVSNMPCDAAPCDCSF